MLRMEREDSRRRSLPTVLVQLIETAPTSPQSLSMHSLKSEAKVAKVETAPTSPKSLSMLSLDSEAKVAKGRVKSSVHYYAPSSCRCLGRARAFINQETSACWFSPTQPDLNKLQCFHKNLQRTTILNTINSNQQSLIKALSAVLAALCLVWTLDRRLTWMWIGELYFSIPSLGVWLREPEPLLIFVVNEQF